MAQPSKPQRRRRAATQVHEIQKREPGGGRFPGGTPHTELPAGAARRPTSRLRSGAGQGQPSTKNSGLNPVNLSGLMGRNARRRRTVR